MRDVVELLQEAGHRDGYKLPRLDLACLIGDFAVKLLSYTQPAGTGSYMRTHLGKVMRYDNAKIRRELSVRFRPARESVVAAVEDLVRWGHLAKAR
jgi:dihydroflavonol-4-reductase